ncbi:lasso RiPP family leader peptide-containing protein [Streptomyces actinomycinicus]|uniref:Lasso RiPP family leader peptide-containing protein n=1 Tax=Streptomyces actinomycinicus TaxID=1695166 RepID=A0A937EET4_9ACTN|nr:lasso RiPP family leader peptide-containing protein [Streptomyces actinomycinicus]MBL1081077.1 lasso RiPP family leader peptide-containing protein [Streptomyces actinomycinicus]
MDTPVDQTVHPEDEMGYEPPTLVEVGDFAQLTMGGCDYGNDNHYQTMCPSP